MDDVLGFTHRDFHQLDHTHLYWVLTALGFLVGYFKSKTFQSIGRVNYFIYLSFLFLWGFLAFFAYGYALYSGGSDNISIFLAIMLVSAFFIGYVGAIVGRMRFIDAFGRPEWSIVLLIPLAQCVMLFVPRKKNLKIPRIHQSIFSQGLGGIFIGSIAFATPLAIVFVESMVEDYENSSPNDRSGASEARSSAPDLPTIDLPTVLSRMAQGTITLPLFDQTARLESTSATGTTLTYRYTLKGSGDPDPSGFAAQTVRTLCADEHVEKLAEMGAVFVHDYRTPDGQSYATAVVSATTCESNK